MANISVDKVIAAWLMAEFHSSRFSPRIKKLLEELSKDADFLLEPDLVDPTENALRKKLLFAYRPYLEKDVFLEKTTWFEEQWGISDALSRLKYMDYSYWNKISQMTSKPREAVNTIKENVEIYGVSNEPFRQAAKACLEGTDFPPLIAMLKENVWTLLEGHLRLTALALAESEDAEVKHRSISVLYGRRFS